MVYGSQNISKNDLLGGVIKFSDSTVTAVRVKDIILDINHPQASELGGYDSIGTIFYTSLQKNTPLESSKGLDNARPLFTFVKNYPLINEIVLIIDSYGKNLYDFNEGSTKYYLPVVNIWNASNHNALPTIKGIVENGDDYIRTEEGETVRQITDTSTDITLGEYFKESVNIKPLLPFEGDTIIEGRFGNSIRFGSTNIGSDTFNINSWSETGKEGDPITIIRNGQPDNTDDKGWIPTIEHSNNDHSSIYLTSNQQIKSFTPASTNQLSFGANIQVEVSNLRVLEDAELQTIESPEINNDPLPSDNEEEPVITNPTSITDVENINQNELEDEIIDEVAYYDSAPNEEFNNKILNSDVELGVDYQIPSDLDLDELMG